MSLEKRGEERERRRAPHRALTALLLLACALPLHAQDTQEPPSVGMARRIQGLVIPGDEVEARSESESAIPVVVRITAVYPHGSAFRYDLTYYGLEAGDFDLRGALRRKLGRAPLDQEEIPPIPITIASLLPEGHIKPAALEAAEVPAPGGYQKTLLIAAILWVLGFAAILVFGRKKKAAARAADAPPPSLEERLRPLIEAGSSTAA